LGITIYVDDIIVTSSSNHDIFLFPSPIEWTFDIEDMGDLH
jgi:hypothetical protein